MLIALTETSVGKAKETVLTTFKAMDRSIINYTAPVWTTQLWVAT